MDTQQNKNVVVPPFQYAKHGIEVIEDRVEVIEEVPLAQGTQVTRATLEIVEEGLEEVQFGEFLVEKKAISRADLFRALCEQDRYPGVRIGEVIAALGLLAYQDVDRLLSEYHSLQVVEIGN